MENNIFESGKFFLGCNWWASHAGTNMWHDWDEAAVESDIKRLKEAKMSVMRVFPMWSDFQPLRMHFGGSSSRRELRLREDPLPETEAGRAGIDEVMVERFEKLCDIAEKYDMKLIVGLVTGWMSGRMHMPEAFAGLDLIKDPMVVRWQVKFVKYMVRRFKHKKAIAAWDLGNECNCMANPGITRDESYVWVSQITNAIKSEDSTRLVISGMHGNRPEDDMRFNARDLGEILDVLCTHPYPLFTPLCDTDPLNEMKSILHATAESTFVADVSGKPCFVEEIGTLGPMIANERIAADYIRASAFSSWAHDLRGFVWWCANEQSHLTHTPYDWNSVERELGLFRADGTKKPVLETMTEFSEFVESFEFGKLPPRIKDVTVVLTRTQDTWGAAYGSFVLAKEAGLDAQYVWHGDKLPDSDVYVLPSLVGDTSLNLGKYMELIKKAECGATLVMSIDNALLSPFESVTGMSVTTRSRRKKTDTVTLPDGTKLPFTSSFKLVTESVGAKVLLTADDGTPAVTEYKYGKGRICLILSPIETQTSSVPGVVSGEDAIPYYKIYELLGLRSAKKCATSSSQYTCLTEHPLDEKTRILTLLNHRPESENVSVTLTGGYKFKKLINVHGTTEAEATKDGFTLNLAGNTGVVAVIEK
ncbi:MAG: cellulase family glycosylhydrolase [Clostridia bacterium]|nr:cellulase family glycosylhydrolase [Clostridia bacterium]